jgi:phosphate starvation-inducible protein PhoH and related proteins
MKRAQKTQDLMVKKEKFQRQQFPSLVPKTENQRLLLEAMKYDSIVVAQGSAGVGKSYMACWHAARKLHYGDVKKIVLIRAYQPLAGRSIGLLPGTLQEKLQPYYQQLIDYFEDFLGKGTTDIHLKQGTIEICSLETIRGRSWSDAIIISEESQNLFVPEVQALVTRLGDNSQMIFAGDNAQSDVKNGMNGLVYLQKIVEKYSIPDVSFIKFTRNDICRSDITKEFVVAFEEEVYEDAKGTAIISQAEQDKQFKNKR